MSPSERPSPSGMAEPLKPANNRVVRKKASKLRPGDIHGTVRRGQIQSERHATVLVGNVPPKT